MRILYIGQYSEGTTSKMRADTINRILMPEVFEVVDTNIPFFDTFHLWRTLGFRFKKGPLIKNINSYVLSIFKLNKNKSIYDLIWVDKGVFLKPEVISALKNRTVKLVHFTPDMAFYENRSSLFFNSIPFYDFLITTKSKERELYLNRIEANKIIMTTQGFDSKIHYNMIEFKDRQNAVSFVGLWESYREQVIQNLINKNIKVLLAGKGWKGFVKRNKHNPYLEFYGDGLFSQEYAKFISFTKLSLGLMSKRFPELHTTRTFEIPACGTALISERNSETSKFFNDDEVVFYNDIDDMISKIVYYFKYPNELESLSKRGHNKVITEKYDYESILKKVLNRIMS